MAEYRLLGIHSVQEPGSPSAFTAVAKQSHPMEHRFFMDMALGEAQKALEVLEVPVGCVVVRDGVVISTSHNLTNANKSPLDHAEIVSVRSTDCAHSTFYVTCEPCVMCMGVLERVGVEMVYYGCRNQIFGSESICGMGVKSSYLADKRCYRILQEFYERENMFAPEDRRKIKTR